jgi:hypothetical protein
MCPAFKMKAGSEFKSVIVNQVSGNKFRIRIRIRLWILLFSSMTFRTFKFFLLLLFESTFTSLFKDKKSQKVTKSHKTVGFKVFLTIFS